MAGYSSMHIVAWVVSICSSQVIHSEEIISFVQDGFCRFEILTSSLYIGFLAFWLLIGCGCVTTILVFSISTHCYIKDNVLESNQEVKKAVVKNLFYNAAAAILTLFSSIVPAAFPLIQAHLMGPRIITLLVLYVLRFVLSCTSLLTPLVALCVLNPFRDAKQKIRRILCMKTSAPDARIIAPSVDMVAESATYKQNSTTV